MLSRMSDYELRCARPDDFDGLVALALASADTGRVAVAPKYLRNPVEAAAAIEPELTWVVAEGKDGIIGGGQMNIGETEIEGQRFRRASLSSLMVHADHRRKGIARALTQWRLDLAGPDAVVTAGIQTGNEGSFANARGWATQIFGALLLPMIRASTDEPQTALEIREPQSDEEWAAAAAGLEEFERGWNLRTPRTAEALRERAARTLDGEPIARYLVALAGGRVAGGLELFESARLQTFVIERLPLELRLINVFMHLIPPDRQVRTNSVSRFWFEEREVGTALWEHARFLAGGTGNAVGTQFDERSPVAQIVQVKPWAPKGKLSVAVRSPVELSEETLLSPP